MEKAIDQDQDSNEDENTGRSSPSEPSSDMGIDDSGSKFTKFEWDAKTIGEAAGLSNDLQIMGRILESGLNLVRPHSENRQNTRKAGVLES